MSFIRAAQSLTRIINLTSQDFNNADVSSTSSSSFVALTHHDVDDVTSNRLLNWNHVGIEQFHLRVVAQLVCRRLFIPDLTF